MTVELKGGFRTEDPRLDRIPEFDERSRAFPIREVVPADVTSRGWPLATILNQGNLGACVSFSWHTEAAAQPAVCKVTDQMARARYCEIQDADYWPGHSQACGPPGPYYEGTSVLSGAKVMRGHGYFTEYRWAFTIDDVMRALSHEGPVVLGIDWHASMSNPRPSGLIDVQGGIVGGHAIVARGLALKPRLKGETKLPPVIRLSNTWSRYWGRNGECFIRVEDLAGLLHNQGEACVPVGRRTVG